MRTFIIVAAVAFLAVVYLEISQVNARRGCDKKAALNTTAVTCDDPQEPRREARECRNTCKRCYNRTEITRRGGCLVEKACVCLAKGSQEGTTENPGEITTEAASGPSTEGAPVPDPGTK